MTDIKIHVPDEDLKQIRRNLGRITPAVTIMSDAFTLYNWAVDEASRGRKIISSNPDGSDLKRLSMPSLDAARKPA